MALALLVAACSSPARPAPVPRRTGGFRAALVGPVSLDPAQATTPSELQTARALYATLTTWNPQTLAPAPGLAVSWSSSPDRRTWTFVLRPGAVFSDGRPVTPADVRATYERVARRATGSPAASLLNGIAGYDALRSTGQSGLGVEDAGGGAVRITTAAPLAVLPSILASPALGILPADVAGPFPDAPVTSGPFTVASRSPAGLHLVRAPGSLARVDAMDLVVFPDEAAAWRSFQAGGLDWSPVPSGAGRGPGRPLQASLFYGFNLKDAAVGNVALRLAAGRAIDRRRVAAVGYQGSALPLDGIITPVGGAACGPGCGGQAARFPGGAHLTIDYDRGQGAVAPLLAADLGAAGITATLRSHPLADFQALVASGAGQLERLGWVAAYPGPDGELAPLFGSGSPDNLTGFASPAFDAAIAAARASGDPGEQAADYREAERIVLASGVVIPLVQFVDHSVTANRVGGLVVDGMGGWDPAKVTIGAAGR